MTKKTRSPKIVSMFSLKRYLLTKAETRLVKAQRRDEKRRLKFAQTTQTTQPEEHIHSEHCHHQHEDASVEIG